MKERNSTNCVSFSYDLLTYVKVWSKISIIKRTTQYTSQGYKAGLQFLETDHDIPA